MSLPDLDSKVNFDHFLNEKYGEDLEKKAKTPKNNHNLNYFNETVEN